MGAWHQLNLNLFKKALSVGSGKLTSELNGIVEEINKKEQSFEKLSDEEIKTNFQNLSEKIVDSPSDIEVEAFAYIREAAKRTLNQRHYDVQLFGGLVLLRNKISEMKTGEGKTLVSTLPISLMALYKKGVHVVTVNEYLAKRDAEWMSPIYNFLGLEVGLIYSNQDYEEKIEAYKKDITYGTNNEFGFDYLRDNMAISSEQLVQGDLFYSVIDEVDSILVDEARTPLIISGKVSDSTKWYTEFTKIVKGMKRDVHYDIDEAKKQVHPTELGIEYVESKLGISNLYENSQTNFIHYLTACLRAKTIFAKDVDYIVSNGQINIVDEFTGRVLEGRRYSDGLHQALEAKENVRIQDENQTLASITYQNYFRMYENLAGMTGTAKTEEEEFIQIYNLEVVEIPTNLPIQRMDQQDAVYKTNEAKLNAVIEDIIERNKKGQPILLGTVSVEASEEVSKQLTSKGIVHNVLNAKNHEQEAQIIAQAGRLRAVTVATNMAGRGVDIKLGGNPEDMAVQHQINENKLDDPMYLDSKINELELQVAEEKNKVLELGGLYVLGTERHDSRRIDNQLRGRSGRQGDPGESRFYLSLEDELMRLFATGAMDFVMKKALPDDAPLGDKFVSKAIERAQNTVEQRNAETRKNVLKYDEVMNEQRKVIYARRNEILSGEDLREDTINNFAAVIDDALDTYCVAEHKEDWDLEGLATALQALWPQKVESSDLEKHQDVNDYPIVLSNSPLKKLRDCLIVVDQAELQENDVESHKRVCLIFDAKNEAQLSNARKSWKSLSEANVNTVYWAESKGKWYRK